VATAWNILMLPMKGKASRYGGYPRILRGFYRPLNIVRITKWSEHVNRLRATGSVEGDLVGPSWKTSTRKMEKDMDFSEMGLSMRDGCIWFRKLFNTWNLVLKTTSFGVLLPRS
jgi:hypothetical protein